ncbi:D-alanyl-D-alanine carboxypeptidase [uncultured Caudovirales phage]|uniref:D-alanyl-D-alanine carboxypeptidase n=1 Tax=uncultured Caudovirales phage TaxID=2100421 RepID=A0A6J5PHN2_9CAUD|nr:D-alanyl-D-alanine carboxypeptidase [uncultured Caudovirales phage]
MTYKLGARSLKNLVGVHPDMVRVVTRAIEISSQDFSAIEGLRTKERQRDLYAQGRTKPGNIVTWTLNSPHLAGPDGFGRAVDLLPAPADWNTPSKFDAIGAAMFQASKELKIPIRWGADWDKDGNPRERGETDSPHFELA